MFGKGYGAPFPEDMNKRMKNRFTDNITFKKIKDGENLNIIPSAEQQTMVQICPTFDVACEHVLDGGLCENGVVCPMTGKL